jgi:hypothetical protein
MVYLYLSTDGPRAGLLAVVDAHWYLNIERSSQSLHGILVVDILDDVYNAIGLAAHRFASSACPNKKYYSSAANLNFECA